MIHIIDYGMGNVGSIQNMMKKINAVSCLCSKPEDLKDANKIILPGVGAFDNAIKKLKDLGFYEAIQEKGNLPDLKFLGICLGMQLLANGSDEGDLPGLGLIPGWVRKFDLSAEYKVPHMGWNRVSNKGDNPLLNGLDDNKFYFVHSYHYVVEKAQCQIGETMYDKPFTSMVRHNKIFGAQFHPEKSHKYGIQLFKNFVELN